MVRFKVITCDCIHLPPWRLAKNESIRQVQLHMRHSTSPETYAEAAVTHLATPGRFLQLISLAANLLKDLAS